MIQSRRVSGNPLFFYLSCVTTNKTNFPKDSTALDKSHRWSHNLASCKGGECLIFAVTFCIKLKFLLFYILHFTLVFPSPYVSSLFFFLFGYPLHFSRLSLIRYFTGNSMSHCVGILPQLLNGPLMGPHQDLGRTPIDREWNIMWSILIILLLCQDPAPSH